MCIDDIDALQPYRPGTVDDPEIGRLKRIIATLQSELNCYRELCPGRRYSPKHRMLVDYEFPDDSD